MNVFEIAAPTPEKARTIARNLYQSIRSDHDWGRHFGAEPHSDVLDALTELAPREMRRALMTGFGNARLARHEEVLVEDLPKAPQGKGKLGFLQ
jgi:ATP-dependent Lon protease